MTTTGLGDALRAVFRAAAAFPLGGPSGGGHRRLASDDDDDDLPGWLGSYIRWSCAFWAALMAFLVYRRHFRRGRDGARAAERRAIDAKLEQELAGISIGNAVARGPGAWRLTTRSPNHLARTCFRYVRANGILNSRTQATKRSTLLLCASVSLLLFGVYINLFAVVDDQLFLVVPFFLIFVIIPVWAIYTITQVGWQNADANATARALGRVLEGRTRAVAATGDRLEGLEPAPGSSRDEGDGSLATTVRQLQRAGYASRQSWALYAAAMERILGDEEEAGRAPDDLRKVHDAWFETVLPRAAAVFVKFTDALDDTRKRGQRMARRKAMTLGLDAIGDLVGAKDDVVSMKEAAKEMKQIMRDIKATKHLVGNASSVGAGEVPLAEHRGFHPLPRRAFLVGAGAMGGSMGMLALYCFVVPHENGPKIGYGLLAGIAAGLAFMRWLAGKHSATHNAIEDMIDVEIRARATMEGALAEASSSEEDRGLVAAAADLRRTLMDNFYAALALHAASECLTHRGDYDDGAALIPADGDAVRPAEEGAAPAAAGGATPGVAVAPPPAGDGGAKAFPVASV